MKKIILTLFMLIGFVLSSNAQSPKVKKQINKRIEKINKQITASNPSAALTSDQKSKIFDLLFQLKKKIKELKKEHPDSGEFKELKKAETKKVNKIIFNKILTKEQKAARKETRKKRKKNKHQK